MSELQADACVVHCMDLRIQPTVRALLGELGLVSGTFDRVSVAGGAGNHVSTFNHLDLSHDLHDAQTVILTGHEDCGAGATREDVIEALHIAKERYQKDDVRAFWISLDGTWEELEPAARPVDKSVRRRTRTRWA